MVVVVVVVVEFGRPKFYGVHWAEIGVFGGKKCWAKITPMDNLEQNEGVWKPQFR